MFLKYIHIIPKTLAVTNITFLKKMQSIEVYARVNRMWQRNLNSKWYIKMSNERWLSLIFSMIRKQFLKRKSNSSSSIAQNVYTSTRSIIIKSSFVFEIPFNHQVPTQSFLRYQDGAAEAMKMVFTLGYIIIGT